MPIPPSYDQFWSTFWYRYNQVLTTARGLHLEPSQGIADYLQRIDVLQWAWQDLWAVDAYINRTRVNPIIDRIQSLVSVVVSQYQQTFYHWIDAFQAIFDTYMEFSFLALNSAVDLVVAYTDSEIARLETLISLNIDLVYNYVDLEVGQLRADVYDIIAQIYIDMEELAGVDELYVATQINILKAELQNEIAAVENIVTAEIAQLELNFASFQEQVDNKLELMKEQITLDVNSRISAISAALVEVNNSLNAKITNAVDEMGTKLEQTADELAFMIESNTLALVQYINDVKSDFEAQMAIVTDFSLYAYNYAAFGLELPEIGLLNMMIRPEEQFDRFKDFYKLLLAKTLEP